MGRRSPLVLAIAILAVGIAAPGATLAQEVGTNIPIVDAEGVEHGTITVREVIDPFTENDPAAPPAEGSRFVGLVVTYQAALDQSLDAQPSQVQLQDVDGTIYPGQHVARPPDVQMPDLQSQVMAPDDRNSGFIGYVVPADATIDKVILAPTWDRLLDIADLSAGDSPALGDSVTYTDAAGASTTITVGLVDPFTENDPTYPPVEGMRFVAVQPVFENSGSVPYYADPFDVYLRDATGQLYSATSITRPPAIAVATLEAQTLSPGDRISGYVGFQVPTDAAVTDVLYFPESGRVVTVAQVDGAGPSSDEGPVPEESLTTDG
jgi:hypothetical protein